MPVPLEMSAIIPCAPEGGCRKTAGMRSANRNRVRRSFCECCREGPAHTPCTDNDNLFHDSPPWPRCVAPFPEQGTTTIFPICCCVQFSRYTPCTTRPL